ncbi:MAG TPA: hypothetical protein PKX07_17580 [Aggregatilineales bacterium]|jgi:hypothetical protein|nr:hypothetical protein [Aggregatilineales bacterium]
MTDQFLKRFLNMAIAKTGAERALSVNQQLEVVDRYHVDESLLSDTVFWPLTSKLLQQAHDTGEAILTNNMIQDPSQAPTTNTNFSALRVIVVLPIPDHGIIYLDQKIKTGVFTREVLRKLTATLAQVSESEQNDISEEALRDLYEHA